MEFGMKRRMILLAVATGVILSCQTLGRRPVESPIDLENLCKTGDDWTVIQADSLSDGGRIKVGHDKWLMYFLHWRPLTTERENISIEYVRHLLLNFWGPQMPFTLKEGGGETQVSGHKAYYVDATIKLPADIKTRFIVWNCPETGRQFVADCNINRSRGTAEAYIELQYDITSTISCHGQDSHSINSLLSQEYRSKEYNLSFCIPPNWRTAEFKYPRWFPEGLTDTNGSLWTLLTDSDKVIDIIWEEGKKPLTRNNLSDFVNRFEDTHFCQEGVDFQVLNVAFSDMTEKEKYVTGSGTYDLFSEQKASDGNMYQITNPYVFQAFLWHVQEKTYFMIASVVSRKKVWGMDFDLSPTKDVFEQFIVEEVLPNFPVFHHRYHRN